MKKVNSIAIIDDDDICIFTTKKIIEAKKIAHTTMVFSNGEEAFEYFKKNVNHNSLLPEIILIDLNMPAMDGWNFIKSYKSIQSQIKKKIDMYIQTSSVDPDDIEKYKSTPDILEFIVKPLTVDKLVSIVNAY
ncbi:MAG: response regulator [Bacteroidetes bacterium]|nr:response regulator [Bacteroidota bacterium]